MCMDITKVDKVFDMLDTMFVKLVDEESMTFEEIDLVMCRLKEKILHAKIDAYINKSSTGNDIYG